MNRTSISKVIAGSQRVEVCSIIYYSISLKGVFGAGGELRGILFCLPYTSPPPIVNILVLVFLLFHQQVCLTL